MLRADRTVSPTSAYPVAVDPSKVGTYPPDTKSGAGYFYDNVLEYRVWLHPDNGAAPLNGDKDYFVVLRSTKRRKPFLRAQQVQSSRLFLCVSANGLTNRNRVNFTLRELSVLLNGV